ncbi:MAG: hypothetical protein AB9Q19_00440 [Candidatus Reddybacter sp.]
MNSTLGHISCTGCGGKAEVKQAKRRGAHLYTNCETCGIDQRSGRPVQTRLFYGSIWLNGPPPSPENVGSLEDYEHENKSEENQEPRPNVDPVEKRVYSVKTEEESRPKSNKKTIGALILAAVIGGASWAATKQGR